MRWKKPLQFAFSLAVVIAVVAIAAAPADDACKTHNKCVPKIGTAVPFVDFGADPNFGVEGIAISPHNDIYIATMYEGRIYKVRPDGTFTFFTSLIAQPGDGYVLGLVLGKDETLYAAVSGCNAPGMSGVWHVDKDGNPSLVMQVNTGPRCSAVPNNLVFDDAGNLYVTDSTYGSVWRLGWDGCIHEWLHDPLLMPTTHMGGNGIAYRNHSLWIINSDTASIIQVPIQTDGSAGKATVFVQSSLLGYPDLANFDECGNLWVADRGNGNLVRVTPGGVAEVMITAAQFKGFHTPTNPVFGFRGLRTTVFVTGSGPNVAKVDLGVPGMVPPQFADKDDDAKCKKHEKDDDHGDKD